MTGLPHSLAGLRLAANSLCKLKGSRAHCQQVPIRQQTRFIPTPPPPRLHPRKWSSCAIGSLFIFWRECHLSEMEILKQVIPLKSHRDTHLLLADCRPNVSAEDPAPAARCYRWPAAVEQARGAPKAGVCERALLGGTA